MRRRPYIAAGAAGLFLALAVGVGGAAATNSSASAGGTFTVLTTQAVPNLYPHPNTGGDSVFRMVIWQPLVDLVGRAKVVPVLATKWTVSPNGKIVTLYLRHGVTFQNGDPFNAAAVRHNINFAQDAVNGVQGQPELLGIRIRPVGQYEVRLLLPHRLPQLFDLLANIPMIDTNEDQHTNAVGTGPFKVSSFTPNSQLILIPNPTYWGTKAKLSQYVVDFKPDANSAEVAMKAGEASAWTLPPLSSVADLQSDSSLQKYAAPPQGNFTWTINSRTGPLAKVGVREAISLATDRMSFVNNATFGFSQPTNVPWTPTSPVYTKTMESWQYNLQKAAQLLKAAGYAQGFSTSLEYSSAALPEIDRFAPIFKEDLAKIGINLTLDNVDSATWTRDFVNGTYSGLSVTFTGFSGVDPAQLFTALPFSPVNPQGFRSTSYNNLIIAGETASTQAQRSKIYAQLLHVIQTQDFAIPIGSHPYFVIANKAVKGLTLDNYGSIINTEALSVG